MQLILFLVYFYWVYLFSLKILFIFRERGREGERVGEKHQYVAACHVPATGDLVHKPGLCPDWESNRRTFGLQAPLEATALRIHTPLPLARHLANSQVTGILLRGSCPTQSLR